MPIYEYQCSTCHQQFDLLQKLSDAPATLCPNCNNQTAVRLVSAAGFQLKGNGWYVTDFKNKTSTPAGGSSDAPAAASKPSADKKD